MLISDWSSDVCSSDLVRWLAPLAESRCEKLCAGFGSSGVPTGECSPARQASMPDSPPQAIHGLLSASPGRDAAPAIRCHGFFIDNGGSRAVGDVTPTYAASNEAPLATPR